MKNLLYINKSLTKKLVIILGISFVAFLAFFNKSYLKNYNKYEEVNTSSKKTYISDFYKDSEVDKSVQKLNSKLKNNYTKEETIAVLLDYYKDITEEYFGKSSGNSYYNKINNTINVSIKSRNISIKKLIQSDYEIQNEWNLIISKIANFTRKTKGCISELSSYDINIQIDIVDIEENEVMATVRNGNISYSVT